LIPPDHTSARLLYVGIDDTDTPDTPGTNQLARRIAARLKDRYRTHRIVRHQLLVDPRIPYTSGNGCASLLLEPLKNEPWDALIRWLIEAVNAWSPAGADPGLCVCEKAAPELEEFGRRCQRSVVSQDDARRAAEAVGCRLFGLGGSHDGVIGATAAVGLASTGNDGRVIHLGRSPIDISDVTGIQSVAAIRACGVDSVRCRTTGQEIDGGNIDVGKKLRPNLCSQEIVLFVEPVLSEVSVGAADRPANKTSGAEVPDVSWKAVKLP